MSRVTRRAARSVTAVLAAATILGGVVFSAAAGASPQPAQTPLHPVGSPYAPKAKPPPIGAEAARSPDAPAAADPPSGYLFHTRAFENGVSDGAYGYFTVAKPVLATEDFHSLAEMSVQLGSEQIVEVGWTVDRAVNGDDDPHLFVFHWVNGNPTCYNGCGFVPMNDGAAVGMKMPVSASDVQEFWVRHLFGVWFVGYNDHYVGYFPDSLWGGEFTHTSIVQWFGEVSSATVSPCTEMGNGTYPAAGTAARIQNVGFINGPAADISTESESTAYYPILRTGPASMSYGGPGSCRTVPNVIGTNPTVAAHIITAAALVRGTVSAVPDPLCENLNRVTSQSPGAGRRVPPGARVNITYGIAPRTGCPNPRQ